MLAGSLNSVKFMKYKLFFTHYITKLLLKENCDKTRKYFRNVSKCNHSYCVLVSLYVSNTNKTFRVILILSYKTESKANAKKSFGFSLNSHMFRESKVVYDQHKYHETSNYS